ncbi:P-loop containing nucleoside triphosphate hydrolase protein [Mycena floridula]|nr:P-loop containing nucleoside triphosphate hydrolase protein [Mycena floridula]
MLFSVPATIARACLGSRNWSTRIPAIVLDKPVKPDDNSPLKTRINQVFGNHKAAEFLTATGPPSNVIVTGRANVGKSTLLNSVLNRKSLVNVSKRPGHTQTINYFRVGDPGKLIVVDAPGYGSRGRPEWGESFQKYVEQRKTLRAVYILFQINHDFSEADVQMLSYLSSVMLTPEGRQRFILQAIMTQTDTFRYPGKLQARGMYMREELKKLAPLCRPPLFTAAKQKTANGSEAVRGNILQACGLL